MTEENLGIFLLQVLLLLGPTLLGRALPELQLALLPPDTTQQTMSETVSWCGVLFLLLETGLEVDLSAAWRQRGPVLKAGIIGVLVPLVVSFGLSMLLPDRYLAAPGTRMPFALFLGTTMAISAMVIIVRVLHDLGLVKIDLGLVTLCGCGQRRAGLGDPERRRGGAGTPHPGLRPISGRNRLGRPRRRARPPRVPASHAARRRTRTPAPDPRGARSWAQSGIRTEATDAGNVGGGTLDGARSGATEPEDRQGDRRGHVAEIRRERSIGLR